METRATATSKSSFSSVHCLNLCDIKIVMLGPAGVGKTSITDQYIHGTFSREYEPSITTHHFKPNVIIQQRRVSLEIIDTQGMDSSDTMLDQCIHLGDAFGVVTTGSSLEAVGPLIERIQALKKKVPLVVVSNEWGQGQDYQGVKKLSQKYGVPCRFTYKDLKDKQSIRDIFEPLVLSQQCPDQSLTRESICCGLC